MNTTIQGIDARAYLTGWMRALTGMYIADIQAIPDDKWTASFGGCTRSASLLTADAVSLLVWTAQAMSGDAPAGYDEQVKTDCASKAGACARLQSASEAFLAALATASDEKLSTPVMTPWHMEAPIFGVAQIAASHVWYHDGQLNYIQCLLGDDKVHWMGD